jgi:hypothetical protein
MGRLIALVAAAAGLAAVTPAVAQGPAITLSIGKPGGGSQGTSTTVTFGEKVRVSGRISPARPGEAVTMTVGSPLGTGTRARNHTLVTDSQGRFELIHRPTVLTQYWAVWDSGGSTASDRVGARVRPKVFLRVRSVRSSSRHMTIRFTMRMAANPNGNMWAILQRRVTGTSWTPKLRIGFDGTRLSATFTATFRRGTQRVRIVGGGFGYEKATSRVVVVRP